MAERRITKARKPSTKKKSPARKKAVRKKVSKKKVAKKKATKKKVSKRPTVKKTATKKSAAVVDIHRFTELSISQISLDTGFTRETVSKRLADSGVQPARKYRGYPVYALRDVLPSLYQQVDGVFDPDKLKPFERRAFYQGELDKLKLQSERGELVPSFEVERQLARLFKIMVQHLETLPDTLERDVGASASQLVHIERSIDKVRDELYREVIGDEDDDVDSPAENGA